MYKNIVNVLGKFILMNDNNIKKITGNITEILEKIAGNNPKNSGENRRKYYRNAIPVTNITGICTCDCKGVSNTPKIQCHK